MKCSIRPGMNQLLFTKPTKASAMVQNLGLREETVRAS